MNGRNPCVSLLIAAASIAQRRQLPAKIGPPDTLVFRISGARDRGGHTKKKQIGGSKVYSKRKKATWILSVVLIFTAGLSSQCKVEKDDSVDLFMLLAVIPAAPSITFVNQGSPSTSRTYSLHSGTGCTSTAAASTSSVGYNSTSAAISVPAGTYSVGLNTPASSNCHTSTVTFVGGTMLAGRSYYCAHQSSNLTCL